MKKLFLSPIITVFVLFMISCTTDETINNYYDSFTEDKVMESIILENFVQIEEMERTNLNFSADYFNNTRIGGKVMLLVTNQQGINVFQQERTLFYTQGTVETGILEGLEEGEYIVTLENIDTENYYYNSIENDYFHLSIINAIYGEYNFAIETYSTNQIQTSENSFVKTSRITIEGDDMTLVTSRIYAKITDGNLELWNFIRNFYSSPNGQFASVGWFPGSQEFNWQDANNGFLYTESSINELIDDEQEYLLTYRLNTRGIQFDSEITYFTEYILEDSSGEIHTITSEEYSIEFLASENITEFDFDEDDIYSNQTGPQAAVGYEFETQWESVEKKELILELESSEGIVSELFSEINFYSENTGTILEIALSPSDWENQGNGVYKLIISFTNEFIDEYDYKEYVMFLSLSNVGLNIPNDVEIEGNFSLKTESVTEGERIFSGNIDFEIEN